MHIFNVSITTVQGLKNVSLKAWQKLITQSRCRLFNTCWKNDSVQLHGNFSKNVRIHTSKKSHAYLQCVHNNYARFEECQLKGAGGVDYTK
jgi:hypothetical protein